ncbi:pyrroloquinoline quinone biosynthesis protein PqqF [Pseudomonas sp. BN415]|uniref:pyrroloquinoline quinone biosynthesis protein PqqF n=1 Tax=Pseudomonas sp. BN415 TaxID=2567889 RepID=UPI002457E1DB|nr:pyrroloquinoline quinone biosynthesis protein PqqF [Pseudomonas sp. BN415]
MSALIESSAQQRPLDLLLANGLRVRLLYRPDTPLSAALVEVRGGSHDEPDEFPGMAHFLEHLVFLGSREFPTHEGLIPFVQGLGGRVNASTRARSTRFFCEVPATHLEQALARLLDMLANPLLETDALWREREVLQAEYSARARDLQTLCEAALAQTLAPGHPLADFHAGNASSLRLESPAFIPALHRFHQAHYQPGRMCLTLVAPLPLARQLELARRHGEPLRVGKELPEPALPPLLPLRASRLQLGVPGAPGKLSLAFALERQGVGLEAAVSFLENLATDESTGGLSAHLGFLGLSDGVQLHLPYAHGGQGVLLMDFDWVEGADSAQLEAEVLGWLAFLRASSPWPGLWEERLEILRQKASALEPLDAALAPGLPEQADVCALLEQLRAERMVNLQIGASNRAPNLTSAGFPLHLERLGVRPGARSTTSWRLPPANPYWRSRVTAPVEASLVPVLPGLPGAPEQGALFLRWNPGENGLPHGLACGLQRALRPVLGAAGLAGVEGRLRAEQGGLTLDLLGNATALRQVIVDLLPVLQAPPCWALAQGPRLQRSAMCRQAGELPIRQLLQRLPELLESPRAEAPSILYLDALARFWRQARWQGLGIGDVGLDAELPGMLSPHQPRVGEGGRIWHRLPIEGEAALLLFYPLESVTAESEAAVRLLASLLEPAFHQRLRGELQLGYALACGYRQLGGHRGLLFAVQSPRESVAGLFQHVQAFLVRQYDRLVQLDRVQLRERGRALDQKLLGQGTHFTAYARQCWVDYQARHPVDHLAQVRHALAGLQLDSLLEQQSRLVSGLSCCAIANAEAFEANWHPGA